jgi:hypothetical protein
MLTMLQGRFSLWDVFVAIAATGCTVATYRLAGPLSVAIVISAAAWHFADNDWLCVALAALLGMTAMYVELLLILLSPGRDLGSFPQATLLAAAPVGAVAGGICGGMARVCRQCVEWLLSRRVGRGGWRGFANVVLIACLAAMVLLLSWGILDNQFVATRS